MELKTLWNSIYELELQNWDLNFEIASLERELRETEIYKKIDDLKKTSAQNDREIIIRKDNVMSSMLDAWLKSMEFENQKLTIKKSAWSVKIDNDDDVPSNYKKEKITVSIDKKALKEWLLAWDVLPWVEIVYKNTLLITPK